MINRINEINSKFSVAGYEKTLADYIVREASVYCDECYVDNIGNIICHKKGRGEKLLVNVPISCDGIFVTYIEDSGNVRFHAIGTLEAQDICGAKVKDENGKIKGVILSDKKSNEISLDDLYIDLGVYKKEDADKEIKIGDVLEITGDTLEISGNIYGPKLSKTTPVYAVMEAIKEIKSEKDIYISFSVMDNLGFKGAKTSANMISPDICYTVSFADTANKTTEIKLSKGPAIRIKDSHIIVSKSLRDSIIKKISQNDIKYQLEIISKNGLTNNEIMYLENGILTANINIPVKCAGTLNEVICKADVDALIKSLKVMLV